MANQVSVTNNVTSHSVTVTDNNNVTNLVVTQNVDNNVIELNAGLFVPAPISLLEDLLNVSTGATVGQIIQWDGTNWVPVDNEGGIDISATNGQILQYNGTEWVAVDLTATGAGGALSADINVTDGAGNISPGDTLTAGTTFEDIFNTIIKKESGVNPFLTMMNFKISFRTWLRHANIKIKKAAYTLLRQEDQYVEEKPIIFEVEIDNEELMSATSEEEEEEEKQSSLHNKPPVPLTPLMPRECAGAHGPERRRQADGLWAGAHEDSQRAQRPLSAREGRRSSCS